MDWRFTCEFPRNFGAMHDVWACWSHLLTEVPLAIYHDNIVADAPLQKAAPDGARQRRLVRRALSLIAVKEFFPMCDL